MFWKLYRRQGIAKKQARALLDSGISAADLWSSCADYIENPDRATFSAFRKILFSSPVVATAAMFPAFICPEKFPMVDTQIAKWALANGQSQGYSAIDGPDLACVPDVRGGVVEERHWQFVESWIAWCQFTARKVSQCSGRAWRARDVEMAVFTAQRCGLTLNPPT